MSRVRSRGATRVVCVALLLVGSAGALTSLSPSVNAAISYSAGAAASGMRFRISSDAFPVAPDLVDFTLPSAQATSSSITQRSFATYPYPGDTAASLPGLMGGLAAQYGIPIPVPLPGYPLSTSSTCSDRPAQSSVPDAAGAGVPVDPPYTMTASCTPSSANARASSGSASSEGGIGVRAAYVAATAEASERNGVVRAGAHAEATALSLGGGLLELSGLDAHASIRVTPDGTAVPETSFKIGKLSVAGQTVAFGPSGWTAAGQNVPVDPSTLNSLLSAAGIHIDYISASRTATSVTSAGLQITVTVAEPQSGLPIEARFIFGQVTANAQATSFDDGGRLGGSTGESTPPGGSFSDVGSDNPLPPVQQTAVSPLGPSPESIGAEPPTLADSGASTRALALSAGDHASRLVLSFYLVLVLSGLGLLVSSSAARYLGVKLLWTP